ncbi:MAG TPA: hypothetical protein VGP93_01515 [Polyangiaceae bacterium]|jgi:hypothetical protein|nr:hypothetical protein [Polyangiaceae bacterium]
MARAECSVVLRFVTALAVLLLTSSAAAVHVIPPGQEALMGSMLGGQPLPGQCQFTGAALGPNLVSAKFACGPDGKEVVVELRHPDDGGQVSTKQFALRSVSGNPPAGLLDVLAQRIRPLEQQWKWNEATASIRGKIGPRPWVYWVITPVLLLAIAALVLVTRRRRRAKSG